MSALFPGSRERDGFWRDILRGRDLVRDVPETHWRVADYYDEDPKAIDKTYCKRGAFLDDVPFDPLEWGIPPSTLEATDTVQLLALGVARQVLADAVQGDFARVNPERTSVILGMTGSTELVVEMGSRLQRPVWMRALLESGVAEEKAETICDRIASGFLPWQEATFPGLLGNVVAGRIANRLDLRGTNCVVDAACASSLSALSLAAMELYTGSSDLVITGGSDTANNVLMYMCFSKTPALSPTGDCRPFAEDGDGTILGEGIGMVALRRLADAEADGNPIYAVVRGIGSSSDGRAKSVYAPRSEGQALALRRTYEAAGYDPGTVELVEAHGTGTKAGDAAEVEGLTMVFDESGRSDRQWCALGSVKSQIGHTKSAAGAAGLIKAVLALQHKVLPPTIKVARPNPKCTFEQSPFYVNTQARPWVRGGDHPRRASVSSFGFGGSNFHVTLEEYLGKGAAPRLYALATHLFLWSDQDAERLCLRVGTDVAEFDDESLAAASRASQSAFAAEHPFRLSVTADSLEDLRAKVASTLSKVAAQPESAFGTPDGVHYGVGGLRGEVGLLFPGQGSQYVGMGADLAMHFDAARQVWDDLAETLVHRIVFPVPAFDDETRRTQEEALKETHVAQPAICAVSLSQLALLERMGLRAACAAGHSLGEVTALAAAGVLKAKDALRIAATRGALMREVGDVPGAMLAVLHPVDEVLGLLGRDPHGVSFANFNSPRQLVLSGETDAILRVQSLLSEKGIPARKLPVSTAFHSPLVQGAAEPLADYLQGISFARGRMPVFANRDGRPYADDETKQRPQLAAQLAEPVRFSDQIASMLNAGVRTFVEVGPGSVLTRLVEQCAQGRDVAAISLDRQGGDGAAAFFNGVGQLAAAGVALDFSQLWHGYEPGERRPQRKPSPATIMLNGKNLGTPYPPKEGASTLASPNPATPPSPSNGLPTHASIPAAPIAAAPPAPPAVPHGHAADGNGAASAYYYALIEFQRQTAYAHSVFQRVMADAHQAFLRTAEASILGGHHNMGPRFEPPFVPNELPTLPQPPAMPPLDGLGRPAWQTTWQAPVQPELQSPALPAAPPSYPHERQAPIPAPQPAAPVLSTMPAPAPNHALPKQVPHVASPAPAAAPLPKAVSEPPSPPVVAGAATASTGAAAGSAALAAPADLKALMLEVVAEKTGYPAEMLRLDMDLESDLGIDSIKRVEILSAVQERVPGLPAFEADQMASLATLAEIVSFMEGELGSDTEGLKAAT